MKHKIKKIITILLFIIFTISFFYSLYRIIIWRKNNKDNSRINETLHKYISTDSNEKYNIDFDKLKELNSDTVAYLKLENTNIDYVVVRTVNNDYYLDHNFEKKYNHSGWIFMDYKNKLDGSDKNIIIYGHNTVDKSMFGSLHKTLDKNWFNDNKDSVLIFVTPSEINKYKIFSTYKIDNEEYYLKTSFNSDSEYLKFLNTLKSRSYYDYGVELDENDQIITLSTCANNGKKRVVLHAKKIIE
ncbi:MAG: class B sortase [Bacilli bacterium]|nr:class B sortase [Bacilli bacterium]